MVRFKINFCHKNAWNPTTSKNLANKYIFSGFPIFSRAQVTYNQTKSQICGQNRMLSLLLGLSSKLHTLLYTAGHYYWIILNQNAKGSNHDDQVGMNSVNRISNINKVAISLPHLCEIEKDLILAWLFKNSSWQTWQKNNQCW